MQGLLEALDLFSSGHANAFWRRPAFACCLPSLWLYEAPFAAVLPLLMIWDHWANRAEMKDQPARMKCKALTNEMAFHASPSHIAMSHIDASLLFQRCEPVGFLVCHSLGTARCCDVPRSAAVAAPFLSTKVAFMLASRGRVSCGCSLNQQPKILWVLFDDGCPFFLLLTKNATFLGCECWTSIELGGKVRDELNTLSHHSP